MEARSGMCQCFETTGSLNLVSFDGGFWVGCRSHARWLDVNLVGHARRLGYAALEAMQMAIKSGSPEHARQILLEVPRGSDDATVVNADPHFVHATFHSGLLHFVDDVTLLIHAQENIIDVKSSARPSFYDFGVKRRRVEDLRKRFETALKRTQ